MQDDHPGPAGRVSASLRPAPHQPGVDADDGRRRERTLAGRPSGALARRRIGHGTRRSTQRTQVRLG